MRYTHYWSTTDALPTRKAWISLFEDCMTALQHFPVTNQSAPSKISFDSLTSQEYSSFYFPKAPQRFVFCRTHRTEYDLPVTVCLLIIKHYAPEWLKITSDGLWEDWEPAVAFLREHFPHITTTAAYQDFCEMLDKEHPNYIPLKIMAVD